MRYIKFIFAISGAIVMLSGLIASASARNLSFSETTLRSTFATVEFSGGFGSTRCELTLEGSLHARTMPKVLGSLIGYVTKVIVRTPCRQGEATILTESLPWHIRYGGFTGTLPAITRITKNLVGASMSVQETLFELVCLFTSSAANPLVTTYAVSGAGVLTTASFGGSIPTSCGLNASARGTSTSTTVLGGAAAITIRLI